MSKWYITSDFFWRGGKKILGPFNSQELALKIRELLEFKNRPDTYFVDELTHELTAPKDIK